MAEVKLERDTLGWDPAQIKDEPNIKQEPEEFPFHMVTVKVEDDDDESPVLHLRPPEGEECGSGADSQEHSHSSDTDCSEDYSHQQAPAKRSYAMIPPDSSVPDSRPFICSDCGKVFKDKFVLQGHVLYAHSGERPHECSVCEKRFTLKSSLKEHMKIHMGDKSFVCSFCKKRFMKKSDRTRHKTFVHHICPICSNRVTDRVSLHQHLKTHVDEGILDQSSPLIRDTNKVFTCSDCGKKYSWHSSLRAHMLCHTAGLPETTLEIPQVIPQVVPKVEPDQLSPSTIPSPDKPFSCSECRTSFRWMSLLKIHMRIHSKESPHKCSVCEYSCRNNYELKQHLKNQHGLVISKDKTSLTAVSPDPENEHIPFSCLECGMTICREQDVARHMKKHSGEKALLCSICKKDFGQRSALLRHRKQFHNICPVCSKQFLNKVKLNAHLRAHIKNGTLDPKSKLLRDKVEPFSCADCGKKFICNSNLQSHMKFHTGQGSLQCSECGKRFTSEKTLKAHIRCHMGATPYKCEVCDESFKSYKSHQRHVRTHGEHKRFACSVCDRAMGSKGALTIHMKTHCEERPFVCSVCEKSFVQQRDLTQHQRRIHHICPICSLGLTGRSELKTHLSSHSETQLQEYLNPFACSECGKRFPLDKYLQLHMSSHSEERPFKCSVCEKGYKNDFALTNHMRTHRGDCSECGKKVKSHLSSHLRNVHHISVCSICKERFKDKVDFDEHMMNHIKNGKVHPLSARIYTCSECGELFFRKNSLQRHEREAHKRS